MSIINQGKQFLRLVTPYRYSALRRRLNPRRFIAFGVGSSKSGTHSVAKMLENNYFSEHELDCRELIEKTLEWKSGRLSENDFRDYLLQRDTYAWLEMDASHTHVEYLELLVELFPEAKFIHTVRDCYTWVDSWINQVLNYDGGGGYWPELDAYRCGDPAFQHAPEEAALQAQGLYPLDAYFNAWTRHNEKVLAVVPADRLLVIPTRELRGRRGEIADFLGIPADTVDAGSAHSYKAKARHHVISEVDRAVVLEKGRTHCGALMDRFFPGEDAACVDSLYASKA